MERNEIMKGGDPFSFSSDSDIGVLMLQGFTGTTSSVIYPAKCLYKEGLTWKGLALLGMVQNEKT